MGPRSTIIPMIIFNDELRPANVNFGAAPGLVVTTAWEEEVGLESVVVRLFRIGFGIHGRCL